MYIMCSALCSVRFGSVFRVHVYELIWQIWNNVRAFIILSRRQMSRNCKLPNARTHSTATDSQARKQWHTSFRLRHIVCGNWSKWRIHAFVCSLHRCDMGGGTLATCRFMIWFVERVYSGALFRWPTECRKIHAIIPRRTIVFIQLPGLASLRLFIRSLDVWKFDCEKST